MLKVRAMPAWGSRTLIVALATVIATLALFVTLDPLHAAPARITPVAYHDVQPAAERATQVLGEVIDREGRSVAGATVIARPVAMPVAVGLATRTFETITDAAGRFRLDGLPPGTYWFIAVHEDYPVGSSPAVPVVDRIEVAIKLDDAPVNA